MSEIVIGIVVFFFTVGALDKAFFDGKYGYGEEFVKGLNTMGPLALMMVGIMCAAPAIGYYLSPVLAPFFTAIGSDPGMLAGLFIGVDAGALPLAKSLAIHPETVDLSALAFGGTLGATLTFAVPLSLSMCQEASRPYVAKGLVAGIIATPASLVGVALVQGYSLMTTFQLGLPGIVVALVLALCLVLWRDATIRAFLKFSKILVAILVLMLLVATIQHYYPIEIVPHMDRIEPQLSIVGLIGVMLAGAYPMVLFVRRHLSKVIAAVARLIGVDENAALGMAVSMANPIPMYSMLDSMSNRGKILCSAFSAPVLCLLGDHLGFATAAYPEGVSALLVGKLLAAFVALGLAILFEKTSPASKN